MFMSIIIVVVFVTWLTTSIELVAWTLFAPNPSLAPKLRERERESARERSFECANGKWQSRRNCNCKRIDIDHKWLKHESCNTSLYAPLCVCLSHSLSRLDLPTPAALLQRLPAALETCNAALHTAEQSTSRRARLRLSHTCFSVLSLYPAIDNCI